MKRDSKIRVEYNPRKKKLKDNQNTSQVLRNKNKHEKKLHVKY